MINVHGELTPPLSDEERLNLTLWIQEAAIEVSIKEKHFGCHLSDSDPLKIELTNLQDLLDRDAEYLTNDDIPSV